MKPHAEKLIALLHSIAMYNDKGHIWYRHSQAESNAMRAKWREEIDDLVSQIGERNFSNELLGDLCSPNVVCAESGIYAEKTAAWFSELFEAD